MPSPVKIARLKRSRRHDPLDRGRIKMFRLALRRGEEFPPIDVSDIDGSLWIFDGYHRYHAHKLEGRKTILANVIAKL
jgi:uncharacterized ParB-like nuclease family protein